MSSECEMGLDTSQQIHLRGQSKLNHDFAFLQTVHVVQIARFKHYISEPDTIVIKFYIKKVIS